MSRKTTGIALALTPLVAGLLFARVGVGRNRQLSPAGGAAIGQVIGASAAGAILTTALMVFGMGHRSGRIKLLGNVADWMGGVSGMPGWVALPSLLGAGSLLCAVFGMYWDISLHIDNGRDPGPLANPAHYFILAGLFGIFAAGWFAIVLPREKPGPAAVRITRDWYAPVSAIALMACASFALLGFPLDDISHRLYGQDVTLWGPTHLMLIGGAGLTLIGLIGLQVEGRLAGGEHTARLPGWRIVKQPLIARLLKPVEAFQASGWDRRLRIIAACGGLLIGLSVFQGEFDFGVPQYRMLFEPMLIAGAAGIGLVAARILGDKGTALGAALFFILVRGGLALIVGGAFGETTPHLPLYLAEAALVEGVALAIGTERPFRFALTAGGLIGTVGVLAEWGWSHVWMPVPWPGHFVPEAVAMGLVAALAGGVLGAFIGSALNLRADIVTSRQARFAALGGLLVIAAGVGYLSQTTVPNARATVALRTVQPAPERKVEATVRINPPSVADKADWLSAISWQGKGRLYLDHMTKLGPGVYRTDEAMPVYGKWKSAIRLHKGQDLSSVPVYMPADSAIPVGKVPATAAFSRPFTADQKVLQRERKRGVPTWLWGMAYLVVGSIFAVLIALLSWVLIRLAGLPSREERQAAVEGPPPATAIPGVA